MEKRLSSDYVALSSYFIVSSYPPPRQPVHHFTVEGFRKEAAAASVSFLGRFPDVEGENGGE